MSEQNQPVASTYSIRQVALKLNMSEQYVRQLILTEKLSAEKVDGKWCITHETVDDYISEHPANKAVAYVVYLSDEELEVMKASFPNLSFTKRFDAVKAKQYRMRKAQ